MPACPADEGFCDEVADRKGIGITVIGESIELVVLLPMLDPDLLVAHGADQNQSLIEMDVVCLQLGRKFRVASKVVIVIPDHHCNLYACTRGSKLVENGLVRLHYMIELLDSMY